MESILFVCTGNTCRSSMAEGIFRGELKKDKELAERFEVSSAGISAFDGEPASEYAVSALKDLYGLDISLHRARLLKKEHIDNASLILTMTRSHKQAICSLFPEARKKTFTLKEFAYEYGVSDRTAKSSFNPDISDPFGMPENIYKQCAREIKDAVVRTVEKLRNYEK